MWKSIYWKIVALIFFVGASFPLRGFLLNTRSDITVILGLLLPFVTVFVVIVSVISLVKQTSKD